MFEDLDALAQGAAEAFVHACRNAIQARGRFVVALSGGSTPRKVNALLASPPYCDFVEWPLVHVFFGDERFVPPSDNSSNEKMARDTLLDLVPIPRENIFGMYDEVPAEEAAANYEKKLRELLGEEAVFDLVFLGLGPDGHTASLFPGRPTVHIDDRLVVAAEANVGVGQRITMTTPLINRAREIFFLVSGPDKAEALRRVLEEEEDWDQTPAQAVARHAGNVKFLVDERSASALTHKPE